jgi:hypothetical protein
VTARLADLEYTHPLYLQRGPTSPVIEVRAELPGGGDAAYVTWARVVAPADSTADYLHLYVDTALTTHSGSWWGRAWVSAASPDTAAEPRRSERAGLRLIGQFELALERPDVPGAGPDWAEPRTPAPVAQLTALIQGERIPVELETGENGALPVLRAPGGWPAGWSQRGYLLHPFDADHPDPRARPVELELFRAHGETAEVRRRIVEREIAPYRTIVVGPASAGEAREWNAS